MADVNAGLRAGQFVHRAASSPGCWGLRRGSSWGEAGGVIICRRKLFATGPTTQRQEDFALKLGL